VTQPSHLQDPSLLAPMDFNDLEPVRIPVPYRGVEYVLCEASEADAVKWNNFKLQSGRFDPATGKFSGHGDLAASEPLLVSLCLFLPPGTPGGEPTKRVPLAVVNSWPAKVVARLFERAKAISELDGREEPDTVESVTAQIAELQAKLSQLRKDRDAGDAAKNGQGGGTGSSDDALS
jgi:hypothetical protein